MLAEACFVWNHALALQKRYYRIYHKYIDAYKIQKHFDKRFKRVFLHSHTRQEIFQRIDKIYKNFFNHLCKRPPKFRKENNFYSIVFKGYGGYSIKDNNFVINRIKKKFKFYKNREINRTIKQISLKRNRLGEYFICIVTDAEPKKYGKSHNGASIGIDFGLKTYLTLSNGTRYDNPQYMKESLTELRRRSRNLSKCQKGSNNRERKRKELDRLWHDITNRRNDFQWKLAHELCRKYDNIFIEDLNLADMNCFQLCNHCSQIRVFVRQILQEFFFRFLNQLFI